MDVYEINNASSSIGNLSSSDTVSVSSDMVEEEHVDGDDEATSSCPSSSNDNMFELSDLMSQLPIKRGLSKYYNGKSDSFKNLIAVKSLEDVPKNISDRTKMNKQKKKNKQDNHKYSFTTPKSKISKTSNNKGSLKASILMKAWNGTTTSDLNNSTGTRFIHV